MDKGSRDALNSTKHETSITKRGFAEKKSNIKFSFVATIIKIGFPGHVSPLLFAKFFLRHATRKNFLKVSLFLAISGGCCLEEVWGPSSGGHGEKKRKQESTTQGMGRWERERERNKDYQSGWRRYGKELNRISLCPLDSFALPITPPFWNLRGISLLWFDK